MDCLHQLRQKYRVRDAVPAEAGIVRIVGEDTRASFAADCNYHTIENVNGISGDNLCARSTQCHVGDEIDGAVTSQVNKVSRLCPPTTSRCR